MIAPGKTMKRVGNEKYLPLPMAQTVVWYARANWSSTPHAPYRTYSDAEKHVKDLKSRTLSCRHDNRYSIAR